jgi:hypothetical protein
LTDESRNGSVDPGDGGHLENPGSVEIALTDSTGDGNRDAITDFDHMVDDLNSAGVATCATDGPGLGQKAPAPYLTVVVPRGPSA